ncbi:MAG: FtsX-like permease family protein [Bacteroidota bacterium]
MSTSNPPNPPMWAERFFLWYCKDSEADMLLGDMYEMYYERVEEKGVKKARWRFIRDVFSACRPFAWKHVQLPSYLNELAMFSHYLKIGWRNLMHHKGFSTINILGLALGLACCLLMFLYVQFELSFDGFHEKYDRIVRVTSVFHTDAGDQNLTYTPNIIAPLLARTYPEVEKGCRVMPSKMLISHNGMSFKENHVLYADSTFFDIFSFKVLKGSPSQALKDPSSIVLTPPLAKKYFGVEDPIGKFLYSSTDSNAYRVSAVVEQVPRNSHMHFEILRPFHGEKWMVSNEGFFPANYQSYALLSEAGVREKVEGQLPDLILKHSDEETASFLDFQLQPLEAVYLRSTHLEQEEGIRVSDIQYVYILGGLAFLILLIACINYINLTTSRSIDRAKEVGLRKVIGAQRPQLFNQFLGETVMVAILASALALIIAYLGLPYFNELTQRELTLGDLLRPAFFKLFLGVFLSASILAGLYPALILSNFQPIRVLKGRFGHSSGGTLLRKGLVVSQFVISTCLIIGAIVVQQQLHYIQSRKLGFDKEHTLILPVDGKVRQNLSTLTQRLEQNPQVKSASVCTNPPHLIKGGYDFKENTVEEKPGKSVTAMAVDHNFLETLSLKLVAGRNFTPANSEGPGYAFLINEKLAEGMGWDETEALGKEVDLHGREGKVLGVINDFHFASMEETIGPLVLYNTVEDWTKQQLLVKVLPGDVALQLQGLRNIWDEEVPHRPFEYQFLDQAFARMYETQEKNRKIAYTFAGLALFIAALGLFGLASHTVMQRTKEIGIRKIIGASIPSILLLLSKEYLKLIGIAFVLGIPLAFVLSQRWLEGFAYHISFNWTWMLVALSVLLLISILSIGYQTMRAATSNPVEALKYE